MACVKQQQCSTAGSHMECKEVRANGGGVGLDLMAKWH